MGTTQLSDAELVVRVRAGDDAAFSELYDRHERAAHRLAATYPRAGSADDLVHGAFERVLGAIHRGAGPDESFRVEVTAPGQSARARVCSATILRLDCDTPVLAPTTVALD